jgi:hypothetical protein
VKGHVDARDVLGADVVLEDIGGIAGTEGDELRRQPRRNAGVRLGPPTRHSSPIPWP